MPSEFVICDGELMTPGQAMRRARHAASKLQIRVSTEIGVSNDAISHWENDKWNITARKWLEALRECGYVVRVERKGVAQRVSPSGVRIEA